ncbi:FecR family protein [Pedobacter africanus]|uniref:FecR family protein n=1 Tax=Pedobacter africanus TaxID=151894 RepID=A0A1W2DFP8_9SPHI|nr:FecR domain-containing protein [Pedobacter africanus]SMC95758.1 FecR family protein [Pedobacter africanus]
MTDELLIKFLLNETSEEESITVQTWLDASASNKSYFEQFEKIWNSSKKLSANSSVDENEAWGRFKQRAAQQTINQPIVRPLKPAYKWLRIAAVLVLIAAAWSAYNLLSPVSYKPLSAGNAVTREILPDGSELTLNKNARLSYASNFKRNRNIHFQKGEVFFSVAHDKSRPFVIEIDKIAVLVVGTSFNIKHLTDLTEVIVETGIVKVSRGSEEITLRKGEKVLIRNGNDELIKEQNQDELYNYYRTNKFVLNGTTLPRAVEILNEAYHAQIIIHDPSIKKETIFTTLKADTTLEANLKTICSTLDLKFVRNEQQILLSKQTK